MKLPRYYVHEKVVKKLVMHTHSETMISKNLCETKMIATFMFVASHCSAIHPMYSNHSLRYHRAFVSTE